MASAARGTALLNLPDEILGVVIDKLIESLGTLPGRRFDIRCAQPVFPTRPFGANGLVAIRQTCRRMRGLVDACTMQGISIVLCSDCMDEGFDRPSNQFGEHPSHPSCGTAKHGPPSGTHDAICWHILQPESSLIGNVQDVSMVFCYDSTSYDDEQDDRRVRRVEQQFASVISVLSPVVQSLRLDISEVYKEDQVYEGREEIPHDGMHRSIPCPALRSLRLDDASLYHLLPVLALEAPLLESVMLGDRLPRWNPGLAQYLEAHFGADAKKPFRLPPSGYWKEVIVGAFGSGGSGCRGLFRNITFACDRLVLAHTGWQSDLPAWRQAVTEFAGDLAVGSEFGSLVFRFVERDIHKKPHEARLSERPAINQSIRYKWDARNVKADVPIIWED